VELAILADYFESEIAVVDVRTLNVHAYGQGKQFPRRAYLLYDGLHYDALAMNSEDNEATDKLTFSPSDTKAHAAAVMLAQLLQKDKKFTNVSQFSLKCDVCGSGLTGAKQAQEHATATGHTSFSEYQ